MQALEGAVRAPPAELVVDLWPKAADHGANRAKGSRPAVGKTGR